jgi:hypothetical protein
LVFASAAGSFSKAALSAQLAIRTWPGPGTLDEGVEVGRETAGHAPRAAGQFQEREVIREGDPGRAVQLVAHRVADALPQAARPRHI